MRFLHTADWHLGRTLHGVGLLEDQHFALMRLLDVARDQRPELVVVAGDVFDRSVPPAEAVTLLDEVLCKLVLELGIPTVLIAGNHDSAERLSFGSRLLGAKGLHVAGSFQSPCPVINLNDAHGPVAVYCVPYAEPMRMREVLQNGGGRKEGSAEKGEVTDHQSGMKNTLEAVRAAHAKGLRCVVVGHAFVQGGSASESERPLTLGGTGLVDASCFEGFDYVALGHLHRPQRVGKNHVWYSGSLLAYSGDETGDQKGVNLVAMDARGQCQVEKIAIAPRRRLHKLVGTFDELIKGAGQKDSAAANDYYLLVLTNGHPVINAHARLRERYPNLLNLSHQSLTADAPANPARRAGAGHSTLDLFRGFYEHVRRKPLSADQEVYFSQVSGAVEQNGGAARRAGEVAEEAGAEGGAGVVARGEA